MSSQVKATEDKDSKHQEYIYNLIRKIINEPTLTEEEKASKIASKILDIERRIDLDSLLEQFYNKRGFNIALERQIALNKRQGLEGVLVYLDIDHFKRFNDTYGHPEGDRLIRLYAQQIMSATRRSDIWGRIGGDELAVFLVNSDIENAQEKAEKIRSSIIEAVKQSFPNLAWEQTVSIGLAAWSGETPNELHVKADKALYQAKIERNKVVVFQG